MAASTSMAPVATQSPVDLPQPNFHAYKNPSKAIFPDGIKTAGQDPPIYDKLVPYSQFPKEIKGETVWRSEEYANNPERWTHQLSNEETAEIGQAADEFIKAGTPLTGITKVRLPRPITCFLY